MFSVSETAKKEYGQRRLEQQGLIFKKYLYGGRCGYREGKERQVAVRESLLKLREAAKSTKHKSQWANAVITEIYKRV